MVDHLDLGREFFAELEQFDEQLARRVAAARCPKCGGPLHRGDYGRKPRGALIAPAGEASVVRFSLCCGREGCRRRAMPPSLRFLGRRVYLGAVVVLAAAMQQGVTPGRARRLRELLGVSPRTLARWAAWWRGAFLESDFWRAARARFSPPLEAGGLALALLQRFGGDEVGRLLGLLRFLGPVSTPAGYVADTRR